MDDFNNIIFVKDDNEYSNKLRKLIYVHQINSPLIKDWKELLQCRLEDSNVNYYILDTEKYRRFVMDYILDQINRKISGLITQKSNILKKYNPESYKEDMIRALDLANNGGVHFSILRDIGLVKLN